MLRSEIKFVLLLLLVSDRNANTACCACSFYPLFPPPLGTRLDSSLADHLQLTVTPDVLILPSDLGPFAKLVTVEPSSGSSSSASNDTSVVQHSQEAASSNPVAAQDQQNTGSPHLDQPHASAKPSHSHSAQASASVACVNPGRTLRGYHAMMRIDQGSVEGGQDPAVGSSSALRCRVDIMKAS